MISELRTRVHSLRTVNQIAAGFTDILGIATETQLTESVKSSPQWDKVCTHSVSHLITPHPHYLIRISHKQD